MNKARHPPAFCPTDGVFPAQAIVIAEGATDTRLLNIRTNCPVCGGGAEIIPGIYDATHEGLNLLLDSSISPAALTAIKNLAERAQKGKISPEDANKEAKTISPAAAKLFDITNWSDQAKSTLYAAIIGATALVAAAKMTAPTTQIVNIQPVIERTIDVKQPSFMNQLRSSSSLRSPPVPKRKPKPPPLKRP